LKPDLSTDFLIISTAFLHDSALAAAEQATSFIGRLAAYRYFNMDQVTGMAIAEADKLISRYGSNL